jgi:hypothetical protein
MPTIPYSFTGNTVAKSAEVNADMQALMAAINPTFVFTIVGGLVTGTSLTPALIVPAGLTIVKAYAYVKTAPTGANIVIDINLNGVTIWSTQANRLTILAGAQTGTQTVFDTTALADGGVLTLDVDTIGSTVSGSDLTVQIKCS